MKHLKRLLVLFVGVLLTHFNMTAAVPPLKVWGFGYGPYRDGQSPSTGVSPSAAEIKSDLKLLKSVTYRVRTYSSTGVLGQVPAWARSNGLKCYAGAWIDTDTNANNAELAALLVTARKAKPTALIVGSEVLLRGSMSSSSLIGLIRKVKSQTRLPVGYGDSWTEWLAHPELGPEVDYVLINVHPYWEGIEVSQAAAHVADCWAQVQRQYPGKLVIVSETGWPTAGATVDAAVPTEANQCHFIQAFVRLAQEQGIPYFSFEAFDEKWKAPSSGLEVEAHWGVFDSSRTSRGCAGALFTAPPAMVEIVAAPPSGAGPASKGTIRGNAYGVSGAGLSSAVVVVYAHTDRWYVQPLAVAPFTRVARSGSWTTVTHLGQSYAALLVNRSYSPPSVLDALPLVGGDVLAVSVVPARTKLNQALIPPGDLHPIIPHRVLATKGVGGPSSHIDTRG